ncbi:MAG: ferrous iron transport protein B [Clostridiales bacterium]|nr:ferrous iron transport protein B [Clostridiales bacterium]
MTAALAGNQNSGKTTLFNRITGSRQNVGNFPGVTVEKKTGTVKKLRHIEVVDLPGIYSLSPYSPEEIVTRDFLIKESPDIIINIVDATSLERNLYLTLQLIELDMPMVVALNMIDQVKYNNISIDIPALSKALGVEIIPVSASRNIGIAELLDRVEYIAENRIKPESNPYYPATVGQAVSAVCELPALKNNKAVPAGFAAVKLLEGDEPMEKELNLSEDDMRELSLIARCLEGSLDMDREAALAEMRYLRIEEICRAAVKKPDFETASRKRSAAIDSLLTHRYFGIPIFLGIMFLIFWLTFGVFGSTLSDLFESGIEYITGLCDTALSSANVNENLHSLIIDGVFAGVGSVLSFLPTILILFLFLSVLEGTGYMARVAFVTDSMLRKIGLSGRSVVSMLLGFGCSVPAVMSTRTLPADHGKKMTILMIPFMSCSAKLPIYSVFTMAFFEKQQALVMMALYLLGIAVSVLYAIILNKFYFSGKPTPFILELPEYRLPTASSVIQRMWENARDFITRAFTVIFLASIGIWLLQRFDIRLNVVTDSTHSLLAAIGRFISPVFAPLGFGDWRASTALITGLVAKESVVSTLAVLYDAAGAEFAASSLAHMFTPLTAFSFLVFTLLYMPCVAAMAAIKREFVKTSTALYAMLYQTLIAWIVSFAVYRIGLLFI